MSTQKIVPYVDGTPIDGEPVLTLKFEDREIEICLTYLHHLLACDGWGDKKTTAWFRAADETLKQQLAEIERKMMVCGGV